MATEITLPRLGQGMESGVIVRWLKAEGDAVSKGEALYEIDTEKVTQEVEADVAGTVLSLLASEGQDVPVGQVIAVIGDPAEKGAPTAPSAPPAAAPAAASEPAAAATAPTPTAASATAGGRLKASPLARRMAKERGIDLSAVSGTGPDGRIVAEDVERAATTAPTAAPVAVEAAAVPAAAPPALAPLPAGEATVVPLTSMRRVIARRMSEAWQAPHFVVSMTADVKKATKLREKLVERTPEGAVKPTFSDVITRVVALSLLRHPAMNAHFAGDEVRLLPSVNVGLAVAVDGGLVVPVIRSCERLPIAQIAAARADVVARARAGRLQPADFEDGTFTISNLGMYGVEQFMAVLNPPQVGILAVGAIQDQVVARDGEVVVRPRMELSLSCDHRAVDGATGSEFLSTVRDLLEDPVLSL